MPKSKIHAKRRNKHNRKLTAQRLKNGFNRVIRTVRNSSTERTIQSLTDKSIPSSQRRELANRLYDEKGNLKTIYTKIVRKEFVQFPTY